MSDVQPETTAPPEQQEQAPAKQSFPLSFGTRETGRTHGVDGGGRFDVIRDEQGNPEVEYVLSAEIDGVQVPLATYSYTVLNQLAAAEKTRQEQQQQG